MIWSAQITVMCGLEAEGTPASQAFDEEDGRGALADAEFVQETERSTFIEVDVGNLHWSWGSGAQQLLAARIDASEMPPASRPARPGPSRR